MILNYFVLYLGYLMNTIKAFIDECGTNDLETQKDGNLDLFISVAILVPEGTYPQINEQTQEIINKVAGGHLKSNNIRANHSRRLQILQKIQNIPFGYYACVVDKTAIYEDSGLAYKRSFYKFISQKIYRALSASICDLEIYMDELGGNDFQETFKEYLERKGLPNLFTSFTHHFVKDENYPLIQLADFIAGTLSYCFESQRKSEYSSQFRYLLQNKETDIEFWPLRQRENVIPAPDNSFDNQIYNLVINNAVNLEMKMRKEHMTTDDVSLLKVLRILLFNKLYEDDKVITAQNLRQKLSLQDIDISENDISRKILPQLRDYGIIISGTAKGYRLATTLEQVRDYISHNKDIIFPMLKRLNIARQKIKLATANRLDIIDEIAEKKLSDILDIEKEREQFEP